jgi:hypothetical protein
MIKAEYHHAVAEIRASVSSVMKAEIGCPYNCIRLVSYRILIDPLTLQ